MNVRECLLFNCFCGYKIFGHVLLSICSVFSLVYETCNLGTHSPQSLGSEMELDSGKSSTAGFVLLDCPQSMKIESNSASILGSISDYFLSLSNGWDLTSFLKSLSKVLKTLNLSSCMTTNTKEGNSGPYTVSHKFHYLYHLSYSRMSFTFKICRVKQNYPIFTVHYKQNSQVWTWDVGPIFTSQCCVEINV